VTIATIALTTTRNAEAEAATVATLAEARTSGLLQAQAHIECADDRAELEATWLSLIDRCNVRLATMRDNGCEDWAVARYVRARECEQAIRAHLNALTPGMVRQADGSVGLSVEWIRQHAEAPS
jgi:hypothetical protein